MPRPDAITVAAGGDVVLLHALGAPEDSLLPALRRADVTCANLEVCLTATDSPVREGLTLRADPALVDDLASMRLDVLTLANNHAGDQGWEALRDCGRHLETRGMAVVGIGDNARAAFAPRVVRGVAFVGASCVSPPICVAGERSPGMAGVDAAQPQPLLDAVRAARELSPRVVVLIHWGVNHVAEVQPEQRRLAEQLVDAGASAIFGCHAHDLQPVEVIAGVPVFYGLGSLVFGYEGPGADRFARDAGAGFVDLDESGRAIAARLLVGRIDAHGDPVLAGARERQVRL